MSAKIKVVLSLLVLCAVAFAGFSLVNGPVVVPGQAQVDERQVVALVNNEGVVGHVIRILGNNVQRVRGVDGVVVQEGTELQLYDVVATGKDSRAQIVLVDGTKITLGQNAQFTIDEYMFDTENPAASRARFTFLTGGFSYESGLIGEQDDSPVEIAMHYALIDAGNVEKLWATTGAKRILVFVDGGSAVVSNVFGDVVLSSGYAMEVLDNESQPQEPRAYGVQGLQAIKNIVDFVPEAMVQE